ncbi:oligopeptide/dipeptide ABC transporter ATP-binding protein [Shewanella intestini]|uniref:ATP-binding cassette domain-containing protein n=1 Tax=Shewanella intestini TaxID=2017544 RepID=A0ABS5I5G6_9GAMM|nr:MULTISPECIES: oligopeptide/dipeptide ABC transporter ATP-binding protein [Shewanella]MBR9729267.1 ATP-binding cassette domain-containing protein [Shewanella intestini]MRG35412.1 ATP-binding cassette domain-containing protein [Shewanella sp. XMDDZSB0408]
MPLLDIRNLTIELNTDSGIVKVLEKVSLTLNSGEIHGLVGESGSGRTLLAKAVLGVLGSHWRVRADRMMWDGQSLLDMKPKQRRSIMGSEIAMIFQDPVGSLDPVRTIGSQLTEAMVPNKKVPFWRRDKDTELNAQKWLHKVGIKHPKKLMSCFPWELSDGECQKVMIAMAVSNYPKLIIADEPTNSMEVSTQAQIFRLLSQLNQLQNVSILVISHELETLTKWCNKLTVLYSGQIMESGPTSAIIAKPYHPYTYALLKNLPEHTSKMRHKSLLPSLPGSSASVHHLPAGCRLGPRCPEAERKCVQQPSLVHEKDRYFACHFPLNNERDEDDGTIT